MRQLLPALGMALVFAGAAEAGPIYSCPNGSSQCSGQTFAEWISGSGVDGGGQYFEISLSINTTGYTGDEGDLARGVEFKNILDTNTTYTNLDLVAAPGGTGNWTEGNHQLSQACAGGTFNDTGCAVWSGAGGGYDFFIGEILTWTFRFNAASLGDSTGHFKYTYTDAFNVNSGRWNQVAGLLSEDISLQECRDGECDTVPEPTTLLLFGSGLAVLAARRRRRA